jgi:hypothetical protein
MPIPLTNDVGSLQCCASAWLERPPRVSPRHHLSCCASVVVFGCLPLDEQLLGGLGLALQPSQPWLLVHPGHLLASRQPLARDGVDEQIFEEQRDEADEQHVHTSSAAAASRSHCCHSQARGSAAAKAPRPVTRRRCRPAPPGPRSRSAALGHGAAWRAAAAGWPPTPGQGRTARPWSGPSMRSPWRGIIPHHTHAVNQLLTSVPSGGSRTWSSVP